MLDDLLQKVPEAQEDESILSNGLEITEVFTS